MIFIKVLTYSSILLKMNLNKIKFKTNKKRKLLILFNDMIGDTLSNKKLDPIVTELFIRGRKLNISLVFITQSYFAVPKILE